jgi:hypothetical protein
MEINFKPRKNIFYVCYIKNDNDGEDIRYYNTTIEVAEGLSIALGFRNNMLLTPSIIRNIVNKPQLKHRRWKHIRIVKKDLRKIKDLKEN